MVRKKEDRKSEAVAIILAFLISGAGHMYASKVAKGFVILGIQIVLYFIIMGGGVIPAGPVMIGIYIWQIIDANREVKEYNEGFREKHQLK